MQLDLNCDLGEGESSAKTAALMTSITSANIACGGHAGNIQCMENAVLLARQHHVRIGAHPGWPSRSDFGRSDIDPSPAEFTTLLVQQIAALDIIARGQEARLSHVKLHGALYHLVERHSALGCAYVETIHRWWPKLVIFASAGGNVVKLARKKNLKVWDEAFIDRAYLPDGTLVPRKDPGSLLTNLREIKSRLLSLRDRGEIQCRDGTVLHLHPRTLCIHSDSGHSTRIARLAASLLRPPKRRSRKRA